MEKDYYSLEEIADLEANGTAKEKIDYYKAIYVHYQPLINIIYNAFKDVKLEDGIGIWEAQAIDDYKTDKEYEALKAKDEREDWTKLITPELDKCSSSLGFTDAKGMRFCLPAYLIASLTGVFNNEIDWYITFRENKLEDVPDWILDRFKLFNKAQKNAVIQFFTYPFAEVEIQKYGWNNDELHSDYQKAIDMFWSK